MINESGHISVNEIQTHLSRFEKFIIPYFADMLITDISIEDIGRWQKSLQADKDVSSDRMSRSLRYF